MPRSRKLLPRCARKGRAVAFSPKTGKGSGPVATADANHLLFGNPSDADTTQTDNYLISRDQYAISYNGTRVGPNWAAWQLNADWLGAVPRPQTYTPDPLLSQFTRYDGRAFASPYARGHIVPAKDRSANLADAQVANHTSKPGSAGQDLQQRRMEGLGDFCPQSGPAGR